MCCDPSSKQQMMVIVMSYVSRTSPSRQWRFRADNESKLMLLLRITSIPKNSELMMFLHSHTFIHEQYNYNERQTVSQLQSDGQSRKINLIGWLLLAAVR